MMVHDREVIPPSNVLGELGDIETVVDVEWELIGSRYLAHGGDGVIVYSEDMLSAYNTEETSGSDLQKVGRLETLSGSFRIWMPTQFVTLTSCSVI